MDAFVEIVAGEARERPHAFLGPAGLFIIMKCVPNLRVEMEAAACHPLGLFRATVWDKGVPKMAVPYVVPSIQRGHGKSGEGRQERIG